MSVLAWMARVRRAPAEVRSTPAVEVKPPLRAMTGQYRLLYDYLEHRHADTVVLTFSEIEDLLGFGLPDLARGHRDWWTGGVPTETPSHTDAWTLASRTAVPNLIARTVVFDRVS